MANQVDIVIRAVEKGVQSTFSKLGLAMKSMAGQISTGKLAMDAFNTTMAKTSVAAGGMARSIAGMATVLGGGAVFSSAANSAFAFNQTIEQSKIGIAGLVRTFTNVDMGTSFVQAADIQKRLQLEGLKTTATYEQLLRALQEGVGPALRNGFNPEQIVKFTSSMTQAAAAISLPMDQLGQELRAIMDGTIDRNARIANTLGIKNEDIKRWKEAGTLFSELDKKLKQFALSGEQMANTFSGQWSNVKDAVQMALGTGTEKIFAATTASLKRFFDAIVSIDNEAGKFEFNKKFIAAVDGIDKRVSSFINSISGDQMISAITKIVEVAGAVIDVFGQFSGAIITFFTAIGPYAETLVKTTIYLTLFSAGLKTLSFLLMTPIALVKALHAAFIVLAGMNLTTFFSVTASGMTTAAIAAGGLKTIIGGLAGAFLAWEAGWQIGKFLLKFSAVEKAGIAMAAGLTKAWLRAQIAWAKLTGGDVTGLTRQLEDAEKIYGEMFAEVDSRASKSAETQVAAHRKVADAAAQSAEKQKQVIGAALDEIKKKYQENVAEIKRLQGEIVAEEMSADQQIRAIRQSGMNDVDAWKDKKKQLEEYKIVAQSAAEAQKLALESGDPAKAKEYYAIAIQYIELAKQKAAELTGEVKDGDAVYRSEQDNIKLVMSELAALSEQKIGVIKNMQESVQQVMDDLTEKSGFQDLNKGMEAAEKNWLEKWTAMRAGAVKDIEAVEERLLQIKDREVTVWINEKVRKFNGGMVERLASGGFPRLSGKLPGSDGPDSIRALLAPGEFIIRSAAVRKYGAALFHALNSMRLDLGSIVAPQISSMFAGISVPSFAPVRMYDGGAVPSAAGGAGAVFNFNVAIPAQATSGSQQSAKAYARMMFSEFEKMYRSRS